VAGADSIEWKRIGKAELIKGELTSMADPGFANSLKPFRREPISVSILNMITDSILSGQLRPGDRLPTELELAERLRVSRSSVREAIKMLSSLGVIKVKRGAGTYVDKSMSSSILDQLMLSLAFHQGTSKELIETRMMIEIGAAELAIDNSSEQQVGMLEQANQQLKEAAESQVHDPHILRDLDLKVHFTLLDITNNSFVAKIGKTIYRLFFASIEDTVRHDSMEAYRNHQLYIDAIQRRDKDLARKRIREALSQWTEYIQHTSQKRE
jgi:GntR family transcriptional repressor for pyruvate dehydrogenase complex